MTKLTHFIVIVIVIVIVINMIGVTIRKTFLLQPKSLREIAITRRK